MVDCIYKTPIVIYGLAREKQTTEVIRSKVTNELLSSPPAKLSSSLLAKRRSLVPRFQERRAEISVQSPTLPISCVALPCAPPAKFQLFSSRGFPKGHFGSLTPASCHRVVELVHRAIVSSLTVTHLAPIAPCRYIVKFHES